MSRKVYPMMVEEVKASLEGVDAFVAVNLTGISASDCTKLRRDIRSAGGSLRVVKNSAARQCLEETGKRDAVSAINGPTALAWADGDTILSICRILDECKAKSQSMKMTGGWLQDRALSSTEAERLASIPSREQLLGMVIGTLQAPIGRLVWTLNGLLTGLVIVLKKVAEGRNSDGQEGSGTDSGR